MRNINNLRLEEKIKINILNTYYIEINHTYMMWSLIRDKIDKVSSAVLRNNNMSPMPKPFSTINHAMPLNYFSNRGLPKYINANEFDNFINKSDIYKELWKIRNILGGGHQDLVNYLTQNFARLEQDFILEAGIASPGVGVGSLILSNKNYNNNLAGMLYHAALRMATHMSKPQDGESLMLVYTHSSNLIKPKGYYDNNNNWSAYYADQFSVDDILNNMKKQFIFNPFTIMPDSYIKLLTVSANSNITEQQIRQYIANHKKEFIEVFLRTYWYYLYGDKGTIYLDLTGVGHYTPAFKLHDFIP